MTSCILFSGGWDSVAVALKIPKADLLFINYGQIYLENELKIAREFAIKHNRVLYIHKMNLSHDIERRNFYLILEAKKLGYSSIYTGNRNILPLFDKYKDSNWLTLQILAYLSNIKLYLPIVGWSKYRIIRYVLSHTNLIPYNCYNNENNIENCSCSNCRELRKIPNFLLISNNINKL
jgi:7-cyano-7-deazaguanine synthase in queuosine biosynthesis